ncbi:hypothetical protein SUDANB145_03556 [Streptomyces sp. enrichment culture]|uniref:hypothetical protein n=1 Tax=Streptomyces sp. enrichment culture TaxID=1795815 RepID=UPI003F5449AA
MMNSAPGIETAEISDADLDNVAGGLNAQAGAGLGVGVSAGVDADVLAQAGVATDGVSAAVGAYGCVSATASL